MSVANLQNWVTVTLTGKVPDRSYGVLAAAFGKLLYFGGGAARGCWATYDGVAWTELTGDMGFAMSQGRVYTAMLGGYLYVFGRDTGGVVWRTANGATWTQVAAGTTGVNMAYCYEGRVVQVGSEYLLLGGIQDVGGNYFNTVWVSTNLVDWALRSTASWTTRGLFGAAVMGGNIYLAGGTNGGPLQADVWKSADAGATWTRTTETGAWGGVKRPALGAVGSTLVLFGGERTGDLNYGTYGSSAGVAWATEAGTAAFPEEYGSEASWCVPYKGGFWVAPYRIFGVLFYRPAPGASGDVVVPVVTTRVPAERERVSWPEYMPIHPNGPKGEKQIQEEFRNVAAYTRRVTRVAEQTGLRAVTPAAATESGTVTVVEGGGGAGAITSGRLWGLGGDGTFGWAIARPIGMVRALGATDAATAAGGALRSRNVGRVLLPVETGSALAVGASPAFVSQTEAGKVVAGVPASGWKQFVGVFVEAARPDGYAAVEMMLDQQATR